MTPLRIALLMMLLQVGQATRQSNTPALASVEGTVVDRVTRTPLPDIAVEISGIVKTSIEVYFAKTDKTGKFLIRNLPSGVAYWLVASAPQTKDRRYMPVVYGQRGISGPGSQITLQPNQQLTGVQLELVPTGTISGRIVNEKGKPLENVNVASFSPSYAGGPKALGFADAIYGRGTLMRGSAQTNSRGEYQITGLPPGQYYVSVTGRDVPNALALGPSRPNYAFSDYWGTTYYPDTRDPWAAMPIDLHAGGSVRNVDMRMAPVGYRRVRGVIVDDKTGTRVLSAQLLVVPGNAVPGSGQTRTIEAQKGDFQIDNVLPGPYWLVAFATDNNRELVGRALIEVGKEHLDGVTVKVGLGSAVVGRIVSDSNLSGSVVTLRPKAPSEPGILLQPTRPNVTLNSGASLFSINDNGMIRSALAMPTVTAIGDDGGRFSLKNAVAWDYTVELKSSKQDSYVKSIRLGSRDVFSEGLSLDTPVSEILEISVGEDAGVLDGRVTNDKSKPVENIRAVLVPAVPHPNRADRFKSAWTDRTGHFRMAGVPPGDYILYAWEHTEEDAWRDPNFLRLYEGRGTPVQIRPRMEERVETPLIPPWL